MCTEIKLNVGLVQLYKKILLSVPVNYPTISHGIVLE